MLVGFFYNASNMNEDLIVIHDEYLLQQRAQVDTYEKHVTWNVVHFFLICTHFSLSTARKEEL